MGLLSGGRGSLPGRDDRLDVHVRAHLRVDVVRTREHVEVLMHGPVRLSIGAVYRSDHDIHCHPSRLTPECRPRSVQLQVTLRSQEVSRVPRSTSLRIGRRSQRRAFAIHPTSNTAAPAASFRPVASRYAGCGFWSQPPPCSGSVKWATMARVAAPSPVVFTAQSRAWLMRFVLPSGLPSCEFTPTASQLISAIRLASSFRARACRERWRSTWTDGAV